MLYEASTVAKAIEKAWADSGRPLEFTINVLEVGERNFLGFTKRAAVVSITYQDKKQPVRFGKKNEHVVAPTKNVKQSIPTKAKLEQKSEIKHKKKDDFNQERPSEPKQPLAKQLVPHQKFEDSWTTELLDEVHVWLKEINTQLGYSIPFALQVEQKILHIIFDHALASTADEERQLFVGLSYLLMQFLKKKHKKRFNGFHIVITTKGHVSDKTRSTPSH